MLLIGEAISCMSRDRSLSLECDGVNFPHRVSTQRRGRPSFEIKQEQLAFLLKQVFKVPNIAQLFCVSTRTIERRMAAYGLSVSGMKYYCHYIEIIFYSLITDNLLMSYSRVKYNSWRALSSYSSCDTLLY